MTISVKPNNTGGLFAIMALIGATSLTLLPVALELAVELTRNPDGSAAILWFSYALFFPLLPNMFLFTKHRSGNLFGIIFVVGQFQYTLTPNILH